MWPNTFETAGFEPKSRKETSADHRVAILVLLFIKPYRLYSKYYSLIRYWFYH
jgi:hypothetical protein